MGHWSLRVAASAGNHLTQGAGDGLDKQALADQLVRKLREIAVAAERDLRASTDMDEQETMTSAEREDVRAAAGNGGLVRGQEARVTQARNALAIAEAFTPKPLPKGSPVQLGAVVEIEDEDTGRGRTLFLAPSGAGIELDLPDDGFLSVVTPGSPIGRAIMGQRLGEAFDISVDGRTSSWEITWIA